MSNGPRARGGAAIIYFWGLVGALLFMSTLQAIMNGQIGLTLSASPSYLVIGSALTVLTYSCLAAMIYAMFLRMNGACRVYRKKTVPTIVGTRR